MNRIGNDNLKLQTCPTGRPAWTAADPAKAADASRHASVARMGTQALRPAPMQPSLGRTSFSLVRLLETGLGGSGGETGSAWRLFSEADGRMAEQYGRHDGLAIQQAFLSSGSSNDAEAEAAGKPLPLSADFSAGETQCDRDANRNSQQAFLSSGSSNDAGTEAAGKPLPFSADFSCPTVEDGLGDNDSMTTESCADFSLVRLLE